MAFKWDPNNGGSQQPVFRDPLADVKEKIKNFKGGFKGGGSFISSLVVFLILAVAAWTSFFTVQPEQTGVVQRFGAVNRTADPGLHFKWPFGMETVILVPTERVLKEEFGFRTAAVTPGQRTRYVESRSYTDESLMLSGDLNVIDVQWIVQYRIQDPIAYLFKVRNTPKTIRDITEAIMRRAVGNRLGTDVLTTGRVEIASEVQADIQKVLSDYECGVQLVTLELQDVTPPDPVKPAFNEVNEARQDRERSINQAQEVANREIPKARGVATQSISEAEGYATERVNRAQGEANRFEAILAEYRTAPTVTRRRLYLETMTEFLKGVKGVYIVDQDQKALVPWIGVDSQAAPKVGGGQ
jgi:membrane protease subunit HflK